jgi:ABC-type multidrug transport system permease subunit
MFMFVLFTSSYAPKHLLAPWLETVATYNPVDRIVNGLRAGFVAEVTWSSTWPALLAVAGMGVCFGGLALRGLGRTGQ